VLCLGLMYHISKPVDYELVMHPTWEAVHNLARQFEYSTNLSSLETLYLARRPISAPAAGMLISPLGPRLIRGA
jgi:hypothetical protein